MEHNYVENEISKFWIENEIIFSVYKIPNIDLQAAKKGVQLRLKLCDGKTFPLFIDVTTVKSVTKDARDYLSKGEAIECVNPVAILVSSYLQVIIARFFLSYNRPDVHIRCFNDKEEALKWLTKN